MERELLEVLLMVEGLTVFGDVLDHTSSMGEEATDMNWFLPRLPSVVGICLKQRSMSIAILKFTWDKHPLWSSHL